jgi:uncharacterized damage-inducible protein DinB
MKELFESYAVYNKNSNIRLCNILKNRQEAIFDITNAYYPTIMDTFQHIFFSNDLFFVKMFKEVLPNVAQQKCGKYFNVDEKLYMSFVESFNKNFENFINARTEIDIIIIEFINALSNDMIMTLQIESYDENGKPKMEKLANCLIKAFNHQTHHRGQITAFLDQMKIENDISAISWDK